MARLDPREGTPLREREKEDIEIWLPTNSLYEVSNQGRVRRSVGGPGARAGHVLKPAKNYLGYLYVVLSVEGERRARTVHKLVAEAFSGPMPLGLVIDHKDGNKTNNDPDNLEYVTHKENTQRAVRSGRHAIGSRHGRAKLDEVSVSEIKRRIDLGSDSLGHLGREFGVTRGTISKIKYGILWQHVEAA